MGRIVWSPKTTGFVGVFGGREVQCGFLAKGVSMATSPMFPWRHCALAGSQYKTCIGMESRKNHDTTFAWGRIAADIAL